jgi:DNA repair exonuclease SbcCD ATPase subunit
MEVDMMEKIMKELEVKLSNLESAITTLEQTISSLIAQKVSKHEIVSAINESAEGIRIKGDKIQIDKNTLRDL